MKTHVLKIWPVYFDLIDLGEKTFELRPEDREAGFHHGDILRLREYEPQQGIYTGREMLVCVTYIFRGELNNPVQKGYAVLAFRRLLNGGGET